MHIGSVAARILVPFLLALLAACGGGGGGDGAVPPPAKEPLPSNVMGSSRPADARWRPPAGAVPASGNYVYLQSDAGETIGQGGRSLHTETDSTISYSYFNFRHRFSVGHPKQQWSLDFVTIVPPRAGLYSDARKPDLRTDSNEAGINAATEGRECEVLNGWFVIDDVAVGQNGAERFVLRFGIRCAGATATLHGQLRWSRADSRDGPIAPPPAGLWQPPASELPADGSFVYLESDAADYVGGGRKRLFTKQNAVLNVAYMDAPSVQFYSVAANSRTESWRGNFIGNQGVRLSRGYYPGIQRYPFHDIGIGAMEWGRDGLGCGLVNGWYVVDEVEYVDKHIVYLDLRFEQRCDLSGAKLRGRVRWSAVEFLPPPGPVDPPPAGLWQPPAGATPATGDYVYLHSEPGDGVGQGRKRLYTPDVADIRATPYGRHFHVRVNGDTTWTGDFRTMTSVPTIEKGHYGALASTASADAARGALSWSAGGAGCASASTGWVVVDRVEPAPDGTIAAVELRFEQRCAGAAGVLRGKLRWTASAASAVIVPAPALLWRPPAGAVPASGNYVYVESEYGDPIGGGRTTLDTSSDALLLGPGPANGGARGFSLSVFNGASNWVGRFIRPVDAATLQAGLYGNVLSGGSSLAAGGVEWSGNGATCLYHATSWFVVDAVEYVGAQLSAIELRFEHRCNEWSSALRGAIRWSASDATVPPGPTQPPAGLWQPAAGATPASGNYVYLESHYGDPVGLGRNRLFTDANASFTANAPDYRRWFSISVDPRGTLGSDWFANFEAMEHLAELRTGFYGAATRYSSHSPARPGLDLMGEGGACNTLSGWFMIDRVSYADGELESIELRFEQHCERRSAPLRGKIRWSRG